MTTMTEPTKTTPPAPQDPPYPSPAPYPHQAFNGGVYPGAPPGPYPPPFFPYPQPADGSQPENGQANIPPGTSYMMAYPPPPPGMVYAYPPSAQTQGFPPSLVQVPPAPSRVKRKQVKMACTNCAAACKRCDEHRPCERCNKYGISDSCIDGQRKERKRGIKRGPYRRKNKPGPDGPTAFSAGEWATGSQSPTSSTTSAAIQAAAPFTALDTYYHPFAYPSYISPPLDGQQPSDSSTPHVHPIVYMHPSAHMGPYHHLQHYPPMYVPQAGTSGQPRQPEQQPRTMDPTAADDTNAAETTAATPTASDVPDLAAAPPAGKIIKAEGEPGKKIGRKRKKAVPAPVNPIVKNVEEGTDAFPTTDAEAVGNE